MKKFIDQETNLLLQSWTKEINKDWTSNEFKIDYAISRNTSNCSGL